jgi:sulfoxide reductase heme-binding subunit YedZ
MGKRWQALHRLIYVTAIAGVVHYIWLVKKDVRVPIIYACVLGVLLLYRVIARLMNPTSSPGHIAVPSSRIDRNPVAAD